MKIGMVSLGCPKNQTDAEIMLGILADKGHEIVANPEEAEAIIVNTCGFIDPAKQESIDAILEMADGKANSFTGGREYTLENASKEKCTAKYVETIKSVMR